MQLYKDLSLNFLILGEQYELHFGFLLGSYNKMNSINTKNIAEIINGPQYCQIHKIDWFVKQFK